MCIHTQGGGNHMLKYFLLGKQMEDQISKSTMLTMYLIESSVDMSSYFICPQYIRLKFQAGNAKQDLWEEEISFPRPAGVAEKKWTNFQTHQPFCRSEKELFYKARCMLTTISQSLVIYIFITLSLCRKVIDTYEVKRMLEGMKKGGVRKREGG